jgi:hypothetical protein
MLKPPAAGAREGQVALLGGSRLELAIGDGDALAAFMDEQAQAFARNAVDDYARARARRDFDTLLDDHSFAAAVEKAYAEAYPITLGLVAEMVEGVLARETGDRQAYLHGLVAVVQAAFDRRGAPPAIPLSAWNAARLEIGRWLGEVALSPPKTVNDIVEPFAGLMLALMPIHENLGPDDYPLLRGGMRAALADIRDRFVKTINAPVLAKALVAKT